MRRAGVRVAAAAAVVLGLAACGDDGDPTGGGGNGGGGNDLLATVYADDFAFDESSVIIRVGGKVEWRSRSNLRHTITPVGHTAWEPVEVEARGALMLSVTFDTPGAYPYECENHTAEGMSGVIYVIE